MVGERIRRVLDVRRDALKKQLENIKLFITTPRGIFSTIDTALSIFRRANRETIEALKGR